jgi:hypothetical protein
VSANTFGVHRIATTALRARFTIDVMASTSTHARNDIDPARAAALLVAVQRGRDGALHDLVRLCEPLARRHAQRSAGRRNDVDDVVQDVCVRLRLKADQIRDSRTLIAWLNVVTRRFAAAGC